MSQMSREPGRARYAGLWIRGAALLLDWLVFCAVFFPITRVVKGVWLMRASDHRWADGHFVSDPLCLYFLAAIIGYFVLLEGLFGATLGKMLAGIRIVDMDGEPIGIGKSVVRNLLRVVDGEESVVGEPVRVTVRAIPRG